MKYIFHNLSIDTLVIIFSLFTILDLLDFKNLGGAQGPFAPPSTNGICVSMFIFGGLTRATDIWIMS